MLTDKGLLCLLRECATCGDAVLTSIAAPGPIYCVGCEPERPLTDVDRIIAYAERGMLRVIGRG